MPEITEMVVGAVVQEGVSRSISYVLGKRKERTSGGHIAERLEMALTTLGLALEMSAKLPITDVWLLHRRKMLKRAYDEAADLLNRHKQQALQQDQEDTGVTSSSFPKRWLACARKPSILSLIGLRTDETRLSCSDVGRFEMFADWADKFVKKVVYGISLRRHHTFRYPLIRQLLEGKTLRYEKVQGSQSRRICIWPIPSEGRGVEVYLYYSYEDRKMPAKFFDLDLLLRISECTDIVGTAISCLQQLASQFNIATEYVIGEIILLSSLQGISHSDALPWEWRQEIIVENAKFLRPDPICCTNNAVSSCVPSLGLPEPVVEFYFTCYVSAVEYILHSSTDEVGMNSPPLYLDIKLLPHCDLWGPQKQISLRFEGKEENIDGSIQHTEAMLRSKAIDYLVRQPGDADYQMVWSSPHGLGLIWLEKPSAKPTWVRRPGRIRQQVICA
ncbi:uncharacterized protein LOC133891418 [Phragmites australis]|uniref:uncharacterized protein LOC133891418 n=1 Tax=Phragmites australis TaxID=29695 RepID=UPI002D76A2F8|nr:uncharacterized protein LOC133891418 [Phragmites australis]